LIHSLPFHMRILILFVVFEIISTSQAELQQQGSRRIAWLHGSATVGPHIQTGVVPIFDKRNTMEPITFTFTTPLPRDHPTPIHIQSSYQSLPSLRPSDRFEAPYAHPTPIRMIPSSISARSAYLPSSPSNRFIPPSHPSPPSPPSQFPDLFGREIDGVRHNALQSWTQLKGAVAEAGVDRDWRALWTKMSGVVEPYVERMTEHLGSAINIALRQQNNRRMRTTSSPYFIYTNNQNKRMKRS
ncbi:hypothetical protein PRIPAC_74286, partial [Pristionchus pacificus]